MSCSGADFSARCCIQCTIGCADGGDTTKAYSSREPTTTHARPTRARQETFESYFSCDRYSIRRRIHTMNRHVHLRQLRATFLGNTWALGDAVIQSATYHLPSDTPQMVEGVGARTCQPTKRIQEHERHDLLSREAPPSVSHSWRKAAVLARSSKTVDAIEA